MKDFQISKDQSCARVAVKGRKYLADSECEYVPESIPMANEMVIALQPNAGIRSPGEAAGKCRPVIDDYLEARGALHFRGLPLATRQDFSDFIKELGYAPHSYAGGIAVRRHEPGYALMASLEDERITMAPHNEMAYLPNYPRKVFFFCAREGTTGGEIPISDIRENVKQIPEDILAKFREKGVRYYRRLPKETLDDQIGWAETFGSEDPEAVGRLIEEKGFQHQWLPDEGISYSYVNPAFVTHPQTGQELWFNQVTELHCSYWRSHPRFPSDLNDDEYPATTRYGDGTVIAPDLIAFLRAALWKTASAVKLRKGDVLALDNLVIQHGRFAFSGPRQHLVSITA